MHRKHHPWTTTTLFCGGSVYLAAEQVLGKEGPQPPGQASEATGLHLRGGTGRHDVAVLVREDVAEHISQGQAIHDLGSQAVAAARAAVAWTGPQGQ